MLQRNTVQRHRDVSSFRPRRGIEHDELNRDRRTALDDGGDR